MMRSFAKLVYAQVVLGIIAYGVAEQNAGMVLVTGTLAMLSWYIVEGPNGWAAPRWFINVGVVCVTIWLFYAQMRLGEPMLHSLGKFILFIQIFKLYERKANRDYAQLIVLSLLQMVCAAIISAAIIFGLLLAIYLVLSLFTVLVYQLKISHDEVLESTTSAAPPGQHVPRPAPVVSRGHGRQFRFLAMLCGVGALIISGIVFLMLPRGQGGGMLGDWQPQQNQANAGFDTQVRLSGGMQITASPTPVMNVVFMKDGVDIGSAERSFLLRGAAMDVYETRRDRGTGEYAPRWYRGRLVRQNDISIKLNDEGMGALATAPGVSRRRVTPYHREQEGNVITQHISLRAPTRDYMFAIWPPVAIETADHSNFLFNGDDQALTARNLNDRPIDYTVYSIDKPDAGLMQAYERAARTVYTDDLPDDYARGPVGGEEVMQRIAELTRQALSQRRLERDSQAAVAPADDQIARAIEQHLQEQYAYTLELPQIPQGMEPISAFLFETRSGHCEYFASAMVAMLRSVGIRSRVVNGFRAAEYNEVGGYYVVRQKNAHAWVEAWSPEGVWKTYDPSPPEIVEQLHKGSHGLLALLRDLYEYLEYQWVTNVITFDATQRRSVMQNVDGAFDTVTAWFSQWSGRAWEWLKEFPRAWILGPLGYTLVAIMVIVILIGLGLLGVIFYRRWRLVQQLQLQGLSGRQRRRLVASLEFYLQMLDTLRKSGHEKEPWQTPAAFATKLRDAEPQRFDPVVPLTEIFYEIRFGGRPLDTARFRRVHELLEQLRHAAATKPEPQGA